MDVDGATQWLEVGWVLTVERNRKLSLSLHKGQIQPSAWIGLLLQHKKRLRFFCVPLCAAELHLSRSVPRHLCGWDRAAGWGAIPYSGRMGYRAVIPHRACFGDCAASGHRPRTFYQSHPHAKPETGTLFGYVCSPVSEPLTGAQVFTHLSLSVEQ